MTHCYYTVAVASPFQTSELALASGETRGLALPLSPAVASGLAPQPHDLAWIVELVDSLFAPTGRRRREPPY